MGKQLVRQRQRRLPRGLAAIRQFGQGGEVPDQVAPAQLVLVPAQVPVGAIPIAGHRAHSRGDWRQQLLEGRPRAARINPKQRERRGRRRPQPRLPVALPPTRLVGVDGGRGRHRRLHRGIGSFQGLGGPPFQRRQRPQREALAQDLGQQFLGVAPRQMKVAHQQGTQRRRQRRPGALPAGGTGAGVQLVFGGLQQLGGQVDHLMALGGRIGEGGGRRQDRLTVGADHGHDRDQAVDLAGGLQRARMARMPGLAPGGAPTGRGLGGRGTVLRPIGGRRAGRVARVLVEARLQLGDLGLQLGHLGGQRRDLGQQGDTAGTVGVRRAHDPLFPHHFPRILPT